LESRHKGWKRLHNLADSTAHGLAEPPSLPMPHDFPDSLHKPMSLAYSGAA
jgi:hypothetical protein